MDKTLLAFFGHHKCATAWVNSIIQSVCRGLNLNHVQVHGPDMFARDLAQFVRQRKIDFLSYNNADIGYVKELGELRGFHVIRDPRDIVVSAYFSHLYSHPTDDWPALVAHRQKLQQASLEEGLFLEMAFREQEFRNLSDWDYQQDNILEIKLEDIMATPYETLVDAFSHLGVLDPSTSAKRRLIYHLASIINQLRRSSHGLFPFALTPKGLPVETLLGYIYHNRFSRKTQGRKQGEENLQSHYRKGVAGDWRNHFSPAHIHHFKQQHNDLLIQLGYEDSSDW